MKHFTQKIGYVVATCTLIVALYSCKNNETSNSTRCADSTATAMTTTTTTVTDTTAAAAAGNKGSGTAMESTHMRETRAGKAAEALPNEPSVGGTLGITSSAFGSYGVIPVKYTCDGQGATPPINVTNIPAGTKSLTLIVHDYNATPEGGFTYWIIWNIDSTGNIPENFRNNHEGMNAAKQYGYTPICAKSGNHRYHFIVYALDTRLVMGKTTTKPMMEQVMKGHILDKGELVGVYNKQLE